MVSGVPVLHLRGTPAEMGRGAGALLGERVRGLLRYEVEEYLPRRHLRYINRLTRRDRAHVPARHLEELEALADSSGMDRLELLRAHLLIELSQMACSALAVRGGMTSDGKLLFGRNVDFHATANSTRSSLLVAYHQKGRKSFVAAGWPGLCGVISGMNQDGLCVANLLVIGRSLPRRGPPYPFLLRRALEECSSVDGAAELFRRSRRTVPQNVFLADARGAAVLECTPRRVRVRRLQGDGPLLASNSFAAKAQLRCPRYMRMSALIGGRRRLNLSGVERVLDAVSIRKINIQSMVFVPADRKLHISMGRTPASAGTFNEVDVGKLLREK
jgi:hypothetical protein